MKVHVYDSKRELGAAAAAEAERAIREAIEARGSARIIAATGASQFEFFEALTPKGVPWQRVEMFHLDEYIGLPESHPASFRKYLRERFLNKTGIEKHHLLDGEGDVAAVIRTVSAEIRKAPIDVAFVGIGENGHLAFNDPPADFETREPYLIVNLDEACRRQQVGEGWFGGMDEVPKQAISMSVRQILESKEILCIVPDQRKAEAVRNSLEGPVTPAVPASILRTHPKVQFFLDRASASLLKK